MWPILRKEFLSFFTSFTGYLAGGVFLLVTGLILWVFPGVHNVAESGYASLSGLFVWGPWLFLFLVPAVTMRMFAEERRQGTLMLLFSRPVGAWELVVGKYLAAVLLIVLMLVPTLFHFWLVYRLGMPVGSVDVGATVTSYVGLFLLAALYAAIGLYASSLTGNGVVAFLVGALVCALFYAGFEWLAGIDVFDRLSHVVAGFGIQEHYRSIRRGVIDTRDVVYFIALSAIFLTLARYRLLRGR